MHFWARPHDHQYHPLGVTVKCMLARNIIIRPYWFQHTDGRLVMVNTE